MMIIDKNDSGNGVSIDKIIQDQTGMFNINIHRTSERYISEQRFSAGCQVFADQRQFADFIRICQAGQKAFGNKFTYTLLHERDF